MNLRMATRVAAAAMIAFALGCSSSAEGPHSGMSADAGDGSMGSPDGASSAASDAGTPPGTDQDAEGNGPPAGTAGNNCPPSWTTTPACGGGSYDAGVPDFGPNVIVFTPSMPMSTIQNQLDTIYAKMDADQFDDLGYALLFMPGQYSLDVQVGFYTHVIGLGESPDDVTICLLYTSRPYHRRAGKSVAIVT